MAPRRSRKKSKRPPAPVYPIRVVERVSWRDRKTGRVLPKARWPTYGQRYRKGTRPLREVRKVQLDARGRILRAVEVLTKTKVIKTSIADSHGSVDQPFVPGTGPVPFVRGATGQTGLIDTALTVTNVFTKLKGAKRITMVMQGRDPAGRRRVITKQMFTVGVKDLRDMMVRGILDALREQGFRTQYQLHMVDWNSLKPDRRAGVRINSKTYVQQLTPLRHVDIQITLEK